MFTLGIERGAGVGVCVGERTPGACRCANVDQTTNLRPTRLIESIRIHSILRADRLEMVQAKDHGLWVIHDRRIGQKMSREGTKTLLYTKHNYMPWAVLTGLT